MITDNLVFENMLDEYLISLRNTDSLRKLVEFSEMTDFAQESDWGQIRLFRSRADDSIVLQFRGKLIYGQNEKRNLVATARLSLKDVQAITHLAEELSGCVKTSECDALRVQVQELQEELERTRTELKQAQQALYVLEG